MSIIIQKFGGTSVGTGERLRAVAGIISETLNHHPVVAVVSAMSGTTKRQGTTNLLLNAAEAAVAGKSFDEPLHDIQVNHLAAVDLVMRSKKRRREVGDWVQAELERLSGFLGAISVIRELSPRSQDLLLATGERLSAYLLTATLSEEGVSAEMVDLSQVVPEEDQSVDPAFFLQLQEQLAKLCKPGRPGKGGKQRVPVVTGFFGMVPGGLLNAVGRGYTDFTTALIAAGLGGKKVLEMQVWKEVDGIFTADPRKVPNARVLESISPGEAAELTYFGSEVLHPFTMERVVAAQVPIRIKNTFRPEGVGTLIVSDSKARRNLPGATAVTAKRGITIVTISSNRMYNAFGFLARVFEVLSSHGVVVDLVSTSEVSISFTVDHLSDLRRARKALGALGSVEEASGRAILATVGEGMKYAKGTAGRMFTALGDVGVNIEMISQGASEINISCVISEEDVEPGVLAVHAAFMERPA